jgi:hypothetical protein
MLVPRFLLGTFPEVRRKTSRYLRSLSDGESMELELVATRSHAGFLVLDDQEGFHAEGQNFQMHAIFEVADSTRYRDMEPRIFDAVLAHPWGPLALQGSLVILLWFHRVIAEASWIAALSHTMKWWDVYCAEGPRFANGSRTGDLWPQAGALQHVLRQNGLPVEELLLAPLPAGGLRALLARHPALFGDVLGTSPTEGA